MMSYDTRWAVALVTIAAVASGGRLHAQEPDERADQPHQCRLASQVLTTGRPAHKHGWALSYISLCGPEGGVAFARALEEIRSATVRTDEMETLLFAASRIEDRTLSEAALRIASDRSAGEVGRIQAMRVLWVQISPATYQTYEEAVTENLMQRTGLTGDRSVGTPLPQGFELEVVRVLTGVANAEPPGPIRNAAPNVAGDAQAIERLHRLCPPGTAPDVCGARLRAEWAH
jgi:hypothetical protein